MINLPTPLASPNQSSVNLKLAAVPNFTKLPQTKNNEKKRMALLGMLKDLDGRDKLMKTTQYLIKLSIYYNFITQQKKWSNFATQLSMTRQVLCLGNAMNSVKRLLSQHQTTGVHMSEMISLLNTITNAVSDDIYCLCRIGILPKSLEYKAERVSAYCWFFSILEDLKSNFDQMCELEAEYKLSNERLDNEKLHLSRVSVLKLMADCAFCGCDIFNPSFSRGLQVWTGLFGALLGGYKVYSRLQ